MENFKDLGIKDSFIKGLNELNIVTPTEIQNEAIPLLLSTKTDLVGQANTGTGKTAAYGLPLLHIVNPKQKVIQGIILCPT
ncbi:MAG: DEAD/DEAH box helicase, partial [Vicingaceae bacterium]